MTNLKDQLRKSKDETPDIEVLNNERADVSNLEVLRKPKSKDHSRTSPGAAP